MKLFKKSDLILVALILFGLSMFVFNLKAKSQEVRVNLGNMQYIPFSIPDSSMLCKRTSEKIIDCWPVPQGSLILVPLPKERKF